MRLLFLILFMSPLLFGQNIRIKKYSFKITHDDLTFYLDSDTNALVSLHKIDCNELLRLDGVRSDKWHKELPYGPYKKEAYINSGYDLGHLTPSNITSYDDTLNYHSFSYFNQAPQLFNFNRGKWSKLEKKIVDTLKTIKSNAIIITGVIYDNKNKLYLNGTRIKIPLYFYKILVTNKKTVLCWIGSNYDGIINNTSLKEINEMLIKFSNKMLIKL